MYSYAIVFDEEKSKQWLVEEGMDEEEVEDDWMSLMVDHGLPDAKGCFASYHIDKLLDFYVNNKDRWGEQPYKD